MRTLCNFCGDSMHYCLTESQKSTCPLWELTLAKIQEEELEGESSNKCLVFGCPNRRGEGTFIGDLCLPCHELLKTGDTGDPHGKTFIHDLIKIKLSNEEKSDHDDKINHPSHYGGDTTYETIKVLIDEEYQGFLLGNTIKYLSRWKDKDGVEDLKKSQWYLRTLIEELGK